MGYATAASNGVSRHMLPADSTAAAGAMRPATGIIHPHRT